MKVAILCLGVPRVYHILRNTHAREMWFFNAAGGREVLIIHILK